MRPVTHRGADVEHGLLADEDVLAEGDRAGPDPPGVRLVAEERGVLADHRAGADGQQVGADRDGWGEDRDALADPGAEGPQIQHVQRVAGEQAHRVGVQQRLDGPEAQVGRAPDGELAGLPTAHEHPLGHHRERADPEERAAAEDDRPEVDVRGARTGRDPCVAPGDDQSAEQAVRGEDQELQSPAQDVPPGAARRRGFGRCLGGRLRRGVGERRRQAADRRMTVDVLDRHRRQIVPLPDPGTEMCHHQRVGT